MTCKFPWAHLVFIVFPFIGKRNKTKKPHCFSNPPLSSSVWNCSTKSYANGFSNVGEASYCTSIQGSITHIFGGFAVCCALVIRSSGPRPSFLLLRPFTSAISSSFPAPHLIPVFTQPVSSTPNCLHLDLPALLGLKEKGACRYQLHLPLVFVWGLARSSPPEDTRQNPCCPSRAHCISWKSSIFP